MSEASQGNIYDQHDETATEKVFGQQEPAYEYYTGDENNYNTTGTTVPSTLAPAGPGRIRKVGSAVRGAMGSLGNTALVARANEVFTDSMVTFLYVVGVISFAVLNLTIYLVAGPSYLWSVVTHTVYVPLVIVFLVVVLFVISKRVNERYNGEGSHLVNIVIPVLMLALLVYGYLRLPEVSFVSVLWLMALVMAFPGPAALKMMKNIVIQAAAGTSSAAQEILADAEQQRREASQDRALAATELERAQLHTASIGQVMSSVSVQASLIENTAGNMEHFIAEGSKQLSEQLAHTQRVQDAQFQSRMQQLEAEHQSRVEARARALHQDLLRTIAEQNQTIEMLRNGQVTIPEGDDVYQMPPQSGSTPSSTPTVPAQVISN